MIVCAALLAALSIVLGKFVSIPIGNTIRIGFENLPIILSSVILGPAAGFLTALCADLLGCVLRGYAVIPMITFAASLMGIIPGFLVRYVFRSAKALPVVVSVVISHAVCSVGVKTLALHLSYGSPFLPLLWQRTLTYVPVCIAEAYLTVVITKSKAIRRELPILIKGSDA